VAEESGRGAVTEVEIFDARITATVAGKLLGVTPTYIGRIAKEGALVRGADGKFRLGDVVPAFVVHQRAEKKRSAKSAGEARVANARAEQLELRTAREKHELIPMSESQYVLELCIGLVLTELSSLPASVTRDLQLRRVIETKIIGVRQRVADAMAKHAAALEKTGKAAA
jgi:hypothetical protein